MYQLFKFLRWKPRDYYDTDDGEKAVIRAFLYQLLEEKNQENKELEDSFKN
jgi:hypothetical protein